MARQRLTYKTYPVSTRVDPRGVFYGLIQGATTEPESSLREIMAYKKITAFDAKQVVNLVEDIIQGGMELTALDGRPRAISSMIKTFLGFDGSFPTEDARVTTQKLVSRVRLLKDLRVDVNMDNFTLINERESQLPFEIFSVQDIRVSPTVPGDILYAPLPLIPDQTDYYRSFIRLTGRRLDEPAAWKLAIPQGAGSPTIDFDVTTYLTHEGDAPYSSAAEGDPDTFTGFYSATLQIEWTPDGSASRDPSEALPPFGTELFLQALNSDNQILYSKPLTLMQLPA